jgi:hypothetical protein
VNCLIINYAFVVEHQSFRLFNITAHACLQVGDLSIMMLLLVILLIHNSASHHLARTLYLWVVVGSSS